MLSSSTTMSMMAQKGASLQEGEGLPGVKPWFLHFTMRNGTVLSLRKEGRAVVEPLGRDSRFSTWFDQRLPVGHSQHSPVN